MVVDFLTSVFRLRAAHGQPLFFGTAIRHYRHCAVAYGSASEAEQSAARKVAASIEELLPPSSKADRILFVRPKSAAHVQSAVADFQVVQIDEESIAEPFVADDVLHLPVHYWHWLVHQFLSADPDDVALWSQYLLDDLTTFLSGLRPKLILLGSDVPLLNRSIAVVAKVLGIPVATIQHGLFSVKYQPFMYEGDCSDYFICWSEYTKRFLQRSGYVPPDRIHVGGYPYPLKSLPPIDVSATKSRPVVFLGQPFEHFQPAQAEMKRTIVRLALETCTKHGLEFRYRPHPAEDLSTITDIVGNWRILPTSQPLVEVFRDYSVFLSLTSSAVVEAGLYGRVAIQIYDDVFEFDHLQDAGACYTCMPTAESLGGLLAKVKAGTLAPFPVSEDYLPVAPDLAARYREIFQEIVRDWENSPPTLKSKTPVLCLAGTETSTMGVREEAIQAGYEPLQLPPSPSQKPIEALRLIASPQPRISSLLDVPKLDRQLTALGAGSSGASLFEGEAASYAITTLGLNFDLKTVVIDIPRPPGEPRHQLHWLMRLEAALHAVGTTPTQIAFSQVNDTDRRENLFSEAEACYAFLKDRLQGESGDAHSLPECRKALAEAIERTRADLYEALYWRGKAEAQRLAIVDLQDKFNGLKDEFDRVRATRSWKARERLVSIARKLRR